MSDENINNNKQLDIDDLDGAAGGYDEMLGGHMVDLRCPQCGQDDQASWYAKSTMCYPNDHILHCECKRCNIEFTVRTPGWGAPCYQTRK